MSALLTAAEYAARAHELSLPTQAFINGRFVPSVSGRTFVSTNPATGAQLVAIAACDSQDVDLAVAGAKEAFEDGRWCRMAPSARKQVLLKFAQLLEDNLVDLALMESLDSGKPVRECQLTDVPEAIHTLRWHAELIDKIYDSTAPVGQGALSLVVREAIGVVGLVLPWNFPLLMLAWKIGPSLAAGCSIVVKPAKETSLTALRVAELAFEAGVPAGVFSVLPGGGRDVGEPIGRHADVAMVSFTGSTDTGRLFLQYAAESNLKRIVLECGGKNPAVVLKDIEDIDTTARHVVSGAFWNMGENCSASSRLIVHEDVKDLLLERMAMHLRDWKTGDPLDPDNRLGSLVSKAHFEKVQSYLDVARNEQLPVVIGGAPDAKRNQVLPTVVDGVTPQSRLFAEEIFGPILSVTTFKDVDEAIRLANDSVYGLAASVYTASLNHAIRLAREIRAGVVTVNCFGEGDVTTPFGGYKESGFGGRDKSIWAHDQYTEIKTIWIATPH